MLSRCKACQAAITVVFTCICWQAECSKLLWPREHHHITATIKTRETAESLFASPKEQEDAFRIYRDLQDEQLRALHNALALQNWQESIALKFASMPPAGTRLIWDIFGPFYNCPSKQRVGTPPVAFDGGKWLCGVKTLLQDRNCVVYSFGSNGEVTFEEALINMTNSCEVHIFDYSLSLEKAEMVQSVSGATLHEYGIGAEDSFVTAPLVDGESTGKQYQLKNLSSVMSDLGHTWIDVLKMDVEGAEWQILPAMVAHYAALNESVPVTQAQIEYHHSAGSPSMTDLVHTLLLMEESGFRTFNTEYNVNGAPWNFIEYSYLNVDSTGRLAQPETLLQ